MTDQTIPTTDVVTPPCQRVAMRDFLTTAVMAGTTLRTLPLERQLEAADKIAGILLTAYAPIREERQ